MTARLYGRVVGTLLALLGIDGFFSGEFPLFGVLNVDPFENLLHPSTGIVLLGAGFVPRGGLLGRHRGALLVALYAAYLVTVLQAP